MSSEKRNLILKIEIRKVNKAFGGRKINTYDKINLKAINGFFKGQEFLNYSERFKINDDFRSCLTEIVFSDGFKCRNASIRNARFEKIILEPAINVAIRNQ